MLRELLTRLLAPSIAAVFGARHSWATIGNPNAYYRCSVYHAPHSTAATLLGQSTALQAC
jgi:hypothetical protein